MYCRLLFSSCSSACNPLKYFGQYLIQKSKDSASFTDAYQRDRQRKNGSVRIITPWDWNLYRKTCWLPRNILVWSVGDRIAQGTLSLIGVHGVNFIRNPIFTYIFVTFTTLLAAVFTTSIGVKGMNEMNISRFLKEE